MKTIAQGRAGDFVDYPRYPEYARKVDVLKSKAEALEDARKRMTAKEAVELSSAHTCLTFKWGCFKSAA